MSKIKAFASTVLISISLAISATPAKAGWDDWFNNAAASEARINPAAVGKVVENLCKYGFCVWGAEKAVEAGTDYFNNNNNPSQQPQQEYYNPPSDCTGSAKCASNGQWYGW